MFSDPCDFVVKYDNEIGMREIAWVKAALKDFHAFPERVQEKAKDALAVASFGQKADCVKPMQGLGAGVFEIVLPYKADAYRVVYGFRSRMSSGSSTRFRRNRPGGLRRRKRKSTS